MNSMQTQRFSLLGALHKFFFAEQAPYGIALVRMFLPAVALAPMIRRFARVRELYSTDGTPQQLFELFGEGQPLPILSPSFAVALYGIMIFALICGIIGFRTRLAFLIGVPLYAYFNLLDAVGTNTKYSVIAAHVMLILAVSECHLVWSVDAILSRWKNGRQATAIPPRVPVWPARLIQMLFCFVYFGAAITKIQTHAFFSGEQLRYWMFSNWNYENPVGEFMATSTPLLLISGYITVVWEITFPFLAWRPVGRFFALGVGVLFHFMTWIALGLWIFPLICTSCYLAFLMERDIVAIRRFAHRLRVPTSLLGMPRFAIARAIEMRPTAVPALMVWLVLATLAAFGATEAEYRLDLHGMRSTDGMMPLKTIPRDVAIAMINDSRPLREKDKFFSFDIGSRLVGGQLANRSGEYSYGDAIIAQCNINPPHEDLWIDCAIEDSDKRILDSSGQFVTRDALWANFTYRPGSKLAPGDYWMILKSSGKEISRRPFKLSGDAAVLPPITPMTPMLTN
ncbi:MAG TPA: HTTM domain-containing protein [Planctomycetaceae bacterium]|nr:HTTM domain-containing protein [Planctomycetaceae bacterium]